MIDIYQFIKYNNDTSIESIVQKVESGAIICFDLEDNIYNWIDNKDNNYLKQTYRTILSNLLNSLQTRSNAPQIGIRINSKASGHQELDIDALPSNIFINSIFIPKVENKEEIDDIVSQLYIKGIHYNEIIPTIETKKGLENLGTIIKTTYPITKIAFGHCDYNLSIKAFPFFHQDSLEYWKWVKKFSDILTSNHILFINSPLLNLDDEALFISMLAHVKKIFKHPFGQVTLNYKQTLLCKNISAEKLDSTPININMRFDYYMDKTKLQYLITSFESKNNKQGFMLCPYSNSIISPQEYCLAKYYKSTLRNNDLNLTYVGGCFPVQENILFEDIFHQSLKRNIEHNFEVNFNINIIQYERFCNCLDKIKIDSQKRNVDYLAFQIRMEPFLRLVKIYYKYTNYDLKHCRSFNMPLFSILNPEKYDMLILSRRYNYIDLKKRSKLHKILINLNYILGFLSGNYNYAVKKYIHLAEEIIEYCQNKKTKVIILGPSIRSNTFIEAILSKKLEKSISKSLNTKYIHYINCLDQHQLDGITYFSDNGIYATKAYHNLIANRLSKSIESDLEHIHFL